MKKYINIGAALSFLFFTTSCGKDFLDVNNDPNNPTDAPAELVLPAAVASTAGVVGGDYAILGGIWTQHYTQNSGSSQYRTIDSYQIQSSTMERGWQELYSGALNDYKFIKRKAVAEGDWNLNLMATVMEAYTYQVLVDLYDQIPFDEALRGEEGLLTPKFQGGEQVYDALIARINEALAQPTTENSLAGSNDVVFNGNMNQWRRFANTLKLKMYLRMSEVNPSKAQDGIVAMYDANAQFLETDAAMGIFIDQQNNSNPLFEQDQRLLNTRDNLRASTTLMSYLDENDDPRLPLIYLAPPNGVHRSLNQGRFELETKDIDPATLSRARISPAAPVYFISATESYFLQAEAAVRYPATNGNAQALYEAAVRASFSQMASIGGYFVGHQDKNLALTDSIIKTLDPTALLASSYAFPSNQAERIEKIITQKWVAMAGTKQGIEAFFERNRTDEPGISTVEPTDKGWYEVGDPLNTGYTPSLYVYPFAGATTGKAFPKRLLFPAVERNRNPNTPAQVEFTKGVWWDVN